MADDSNGCLSDIFRHSAVQHIISHASRIDNQALLLKLSKRLLKSNEYGGRDGFNAALGQFLDTSTLRKLFAHVEKQLARPPAPRGIRAISQRPTRPEDLLLAQHS